MIPEDGCSLYPDTQPSFLWRHSRKLLALPVWLGLLGGYGLYTCQTGRGMTGHGIPPRRAPV